MLLQLVILLALEPVGQATAQAPCACAVLPPTFPNCACEDRLAAGACACADKPCCAPPRPPWYFRAEAIALTRDVDGSTTLATLGPDLNNVVLSTRQFDSPFRAGPRLVVGRTFQCTPYQFEFSYFTMGDWSDSQSVRDSTVNAQGQAGNLFSPFTNFGDPAAVQGFDYNRFVAAQEFSDLRNGELLVRHQLPMPSRGLAVSVLVGARYVNVREGFDYQSLSATPDPGGSSLVLNTRTKNNLWGAEIGALFELYSDHLYWVNFEIKGALCNNSASHQTSGTLTVQGAPEGLGMSRRDTHTAYVADFDLSVVCRPRPWLTARIGYQAVWIDGLALAAENFHPGVDYLRQGPAQIVLDGTVLYHGPHLGLELTW